MNPAASLEFKRIVDEFARWRAVAEAERSPAPAWWWGPALCVRDLKHSMPAEWCARLELPDGATYADGAEVFLNSLADQTSLPWPDDFPHRARNAHLPDARTVGITPGRLWFSALIAARLADARHPRISETGQFRVMKSDNAATGAGEGHPFDI